MEEKGFGLIGLVIVLLLLFGLFGFGRGIGGFGGNAYGMPMGAYGCNATTNCQVEKQGIIDSARTQFLVVDTARQTQEAAQAQFTALGNKIDFYEMQNLRDQLAQERSKNMALETRIYSDSKFNAIDAKLAELSCNVPKRPPFYAAGGLPCASVYPTGCGNTPALV